MSARAAQTVWTLLAMAGGTGCIPIYMPIVEVSPTTGERLRAIEDAKIAAPDDLPQRAQLDALREKLMRTRPSYGSTIGNWRSESITVEGYSIFNPGLYASLERERKDLKSAHARGLLTDAELEELLAMLDRQAERSIVRRWFETCPDAAAYSVFNSPFGASHKPYDGQSRLAGGRSWVWEQLHDAHEYVSGGSIYMSPRP